MSFCNICCLKSGPQSITNCVSLVDIKTEDLNLLSFMSADKHTGSLLPITGIPCDVPVPKNITSNFLILNFKNT